MYNGIFVRNAMMVTSHQIVMVLVARGSGVHWGSAMDRLAGELYMSIRLNRRGSDAVTVYSIRYILACMRSGWYPQPIIRSMVGIKDASKKM